MDQEFHVRGGPTYNMVLKGYLYYVDLIYPLLREGHIEEHKRRASQISHFVGLLERKLFGLNGRQK